MFAFQGQIKFRKKFKNKSDTIRIIISIKSLALPHMRVVVLYHKISYLNIF
jgi:hypothetical protein